MIAGHLRGPHVLVNGLPGSGKSTLARGLAAQLDMPILVRDELLDLVLDGLAVERDDERARSLAQVTVSRIQLHLLATMPPVVNDGGWWTGRHEPDLLATGRGFVQVFCSCPLEVGRERARERDRWDSAVLDDSYERFAALAEPLRLPGPIIVVDTESRVDAAEIGERIRAAMR